MTMYLLILVIASSVAQQNSLRETLDQLIAYPRFRDRVRKQAVIERDFPCVNATAWRSSERPTSVHRLRPGDIDVVGGMGDSLVAGSGAMEEFALGTFIEYRGVSWCVGGQRTWRQYLTLPNILKMFNPGLVGYSVGTGQFFEPHSQLNVASPVSDIALCVGGQRTWRQYLTLPNILKMFNPGLVGYSVGTGQFFEPNSQLNVAFPVSASADAYTQAKLLVKKMKKHPKINVKEDWKMVTMFFGANDLCSGQCYNKTGASASMHKLKMQMALDYLQKHLPRTYVNLVPALDVSVSVRVKRSISCRILHRLFCSCFHQGNDVDEMSTITQLVLDYQQAEQELVSSGRYDKKDDFTVEIQPFIKMFNAPRERSQRYKEVIDVSYVTHDCFHFSQKGHALAANLLWNNLLQPVGNKSTVAIEHLLDEFKCPSEQLPYFFTRRNSRMYKNTDKQEA